MKRLLVMMALLMCLLAGWVSTGPVYAAQIPAEQNDEWHRTKGRDDSGYRPDFDDYKGMFYLGIGIVFSAILYMIPDRPATNQGVQS